MSSSSNEMLHAFQFGLTTKPVKAIMSLFEALKPFGTPFSLKKSKNMLLSNDKETAFIVLNAKGCFSICHYPSDLYISTVFSPTVTGLIDGYSLYYNVDQRPRHYLHAETACEGWTVPLEIFVAKCDELNLWHDVARILAQRIMVLSARDNELVGNDAYSKIKNLLVELWLYPEEIRKQIKVASFLQRRTRISRSRIMDVLLQLKTGQYIKIDSGALTHLGKLPEAF